MANTISADLLADRITERAYTVLQNKLAPLRSFSRDFGVDPMAPKATVQVRKATVGATGQQNATNFESGDSTVAATAVTVNRESVSFHVTAAEANSGHKFDQLLDINLAAIADQIMGRVSALMTVGNYGAAAFTGAASTFDVDDAKDLWALIAKGNEKYLILDSAYYAKLMPSNKDGFDISNSGVLGYNGIYHNTKWTGGVANLVGFACDPQAIAVASGMPIVDDAVKNLMFANRVIELPGLGLSVQWSYWGSLASQTSWMMFDVMFGAAAADTTAGKLMVSA